jgi:uncharacterized protein (DUF433 family)
LKAQITLTTSAPPIPELEQGISRAVAKQIAGVALARLVVDNTERSHILREDGGSVMGAIRSAPDAERLLNYNIDWSDCPAAVRSPAILSGQWRAKGTRISVESIIENYNDGYSPEELATEIFVGLPVGLAREIIMYAAQRS